MPIECAILASEAKADLYYTIFWMIVSKILDEKSFLISTWFDFVSSIRKGTPAFKNKICARLEKSCDLIGQRIRLTKLSNEK